MATSEKQHARDASVAQEVINQPPDQSVTEPYCIYGKGTKWFLVGISALAGFFSPFPANIYFPAIPTLAEVFHVSTASINLTVTIYLAMQGVSPMLWGPLSDRLGRRPVFLVCLTILVASCIGLALTPANSFWLLLLLRAVQAGGCASTIALGAGVIGDISTPKERGGFFGMFNLGPMLAPCIAPVLGGVLADRLGWRSIFWFLAISAVVCMMVIFLFLPETMRTLVGNGSIAPPNFIYRAMIPIIRPGTLPSEKRDQDPKPRQSTNPFRLLLFPHVLVPLFFAGVVYAVNYTITATISSSFADIYPYLSDTSIGLCYLSTGGGMILGSTLTGKMLDREYRTVKKRWIAASDGDANQGEDQFPIEKARLRIMPFFLIIFFGAVIAWGWCLNARVSIAGPLVLQFILGYTSISILNTTMTLMIDIVPGQSSGVIACTNLVRCSLAALLVSLINMSTDSLGNGWTYVLLGGICALLLPLMYVEMSFGPGWRRREMEKGRG